MKNFTICFCLALFLGITSFNIHAQDRCGMEEYMEEMMQDPEYARQYEENQRAFKKIMFFYYTCFHVILFYS